MPADPANPEPSTSAPAERWVIVVRSEPGQEVPIESRMRRWLKAGLRGYGVRCESVSDTTPSVQLAESRAEVIELRAALAKMQRKVKA